MSDDERSHPSDSLTDLIADIIAEDGPPSAEDYAWAAQALGLALPPTKP